MIEPDTAKEFADKVEAEKLAKQEEESLIRAWRSKEIFFVDAIIPMRQFQDSYINWVMARLDGDKGETARQLGISEKTIYNRINYGDVLNNVQDIQ